MSTPFCPCTLGDSGFGGLRSGYGIRRYEFLRGAGMTCLVPQLMARGGVAGGLHARLSTQYKPVGLPGLQWDETFFLVLAYIPGPSGAAYEA